MPDAAAPGPHLFRPLQLRRLQTRNRVVISPMCQYSAQDGHLDDWHLVHLGRFAIGGAGIVFTEATAVQKRGRITNGCPGLWEDSHRNPARGAEPGDPKAAPRNALISAQGR